MTAAPVFWREEAPCFKVERDSLTVSQWAAKHRVLDPINCPSPGPWRNEVTPYLVGIMDAFSDGACREMTLMGATQWGKTESGINMLGWLIDVSPRPAMFVLPTEEDVVSFGNRRLKAAIEYSPKLCAHKTGHAADWKNTEISFDSMTLYLGWAGSPTRLSMRSLGVIVFDEAAKYQAFTGDEADPISLGRERTRWWHDRKIVIQGTPKNWQDALARNWLRSDQRWFQVPCPFCGVFAPLRFSRETVVWPDGERDPQRIRTERLAAYRCEDCRRLIPDDGTTRQRMMLAGVWCPTGDKVGPDGRVTGPVSLDREHRGFHVNALYSPKLTWSDVAAEFLESVHDPAKLLNFRNSWEGMPWEERTAELSTDALAERADFDVPRGSVPPSAIVLTAGIDVQDDRMVWSVHAWAVGERSWTVDYGITFSWEQLAADVLDRRFPVVGDPGRELDVRLATIDSQGHRTDEVAVFVLEQLQRLGAERIRAVKGMDRRPVPLTAIRWQRDILGKPCGLLLWLTDVSYFKDKLHRFMTSVPGTPGSWRPPAGVDEAYLEQLTSEHKVLKRTTKRRRRKSAASWEWVPREGAANHWWDTAVYACAAADMLLVYTLRDESAGAPSAAAPPPPGPPRKGFVRGRGAAPDRGERKGRIRRR